MRQKQTEEAVFRSMPVPQAVRTMAMPAVISQLIVLIYNLADTYFIGQTNNPAMVAGVSLILPVFNLTLAFGGLFGIGGGALLPKLLAQNDKDSRKGLCADGAGGRRHSDGTAQRLIESAAQSRSLA